MSPKALSVGLRIKEAREKAGLSQPQLARLVGLTKGAVGQYETGRATPRLARLEAIAAVTGASVEWLLTGNEPTELVKAQTTTEMEALRLLRSMSHKDQAAALTALTNLAARSVTKA